MKRIWLSLILTIALSGCAASTGNAAASPSENATEETTAATSEPAASNQTIFNDLTYDSTIAYGLDVDHSKAPSDHQLMRKTTYNLNSDDSSVQSINRNYYYYNSDQLVVVLQTVQLPDANEEPFGSGLPVYANGQLSSIDFNNVDLYKADPAPIYDMDTIIDHSKVAYNYSDPDKIVLIYYGYQDYFDKEVYSKDGLLIDACNGLGQAAGICDDCSPKKNSDGLLSSINISINKARMVFEYYPNGLLYRRILLSEDNKPWTVTILEYGSESDANALFTSKYPKSGILNVKYDELDILTSPATSAARTRICDSCAALESNSGDQWTVFDSVDADGYTWYKVGPDAWVPSVPGTWTEFTPFVQ